MKAIPELFDYTSEELKLIKNPELLIPKWVDTNHTSHLSTANFKNITQVNSSIFKSGKITGSKPLGTGTRTTINFMGTGYTVGGGFPSKKTTIQPTVKK